MKSVSSWRALYKVHLGRNQIFCNKTIDRRLNNLVDKKLVGRRWHLTCCPPAASISMVTMVLIRMMSDLIKFSRKRGGVYEVGYQNLVSICAEENY